MDPNEVAKSGPASREEELARKAAALVKAGKPQVRRLMALARPRARDAGEKVAQYVREHETELKRAAGMLARSRLHGPLGLLADTLTSTPSPAATTCSACATENPAAAKFCSECGARLAPEARS